MFKIKIMQTKNILTLIVLIVGLVATEVNAQEQIGVASAVNKNTTDLTLEQERKLVFTISPENRKEVIEHKYYDEFYSNDS